MMKLFLLSSSELRVPERQEWAEFTYEFSER